MNPSDVVYGKEYWVFSPTPHNPSFLNPNNIYPCVVNHKGHDWVECDARNSIESHYYRDLYETRKEALEAMLKVNQIFIDDCEIRKGLILHEISKES